MSERQLNVKYSINYLLLFTLTFYFLFYFSVYFRGFRGQYFLLLTFHCSLFTITNA
jgi:hypothetical protein